jgi:hypothetical protein
VIVTGKQQGGQAKPAQDKGPAKAPLTAEQRTQAEVRAFLRDFMFEGGLFQLCIGGASNPMWLEKVPALKNMDVTPHDVFFAPAMYKNKGQDKTDVLGTKALWNDHDDLVTPAVPTFPSSAVVSSGHGFHQYWRLTEPIKDIQTIEAFNQIIQTDIPGSDSCWNANRLMRVPGTINPGDQSKGETPTPCKLIRRSPGIVYEPRDFLVLAQLSSDVRMMIRTGEYDQTRYASRSERDFAVVQALVKAQGSDRLIGLLYDHAAIGDKKREHNKPEHYISQTIRRVREHTGISDDAVFKVWDTGSENQNTSAHEDQDGEKTPPVLAVRASNKGAGGRKKGNDQQAIVERTDGYYLITAMQKRISTFTLEPTVLLAGLNVPDALVCTVHADGMSWPDVTFPREAFTSVAQMDKHCRKLSWQWLGTDAEVRMLLPYLLDKVRKESRPSITATTVLGLHDLGEGVGYCFLGHTESVLPNGVYVGTSGPLAWIPNGTAHPELALGASADAVIQARAVVVGEANTTNQSQTLSLFSLNEPSVTWPLVGWFAAAAVKPWLETMEWRFPLLNVTGTKEAGKTTLVKLLMKMFGQTKPTAYDSNGTPFVRLALLGSSNAVPIYFNEFRTSTDGTGKKADAFMHDLRMLYDTGVSPRGTAARTTVDFPLLAPTIVDGEDALADPALRDRMVAIRMDKRTIEEGTDAYKAYKTFRTAFAGLESGFAQGYIRWALSAIASGEATRLLEQAQTEMFEAFPGKLGDRTRSNYTIALFGMLMFAMYCGIEKPDAKVLTSSISEIANLTTGRARVAVDHLVETIVNATVQYGITKFAQHYDEQTNLLWFQLSTAHDWYLRQQRASGHSVMDRNSFRQQLKEAPYFVREGMVRSTFMYAIDLRVAVENGLDVPTKLVKMSISMNSAAPNAEGEEQ